MPTTGLKTVASQAFQFGQQKMLVRLVLAAGRQKPYRVWVRHTDGARIVASGHTGLDDKEAQARELYEWTCEEAKKKGWEPGMKRAGKLRMLGGVPAPTTKTEKVQSVPPRRVAR